MKSSKKSPSTGEDNALQGFEAQYNVAAELILQSIHSKEFESVILKDPEAEQVDDIQIVTKKRIDAYQVKWHKPVTTLTYSELYGNKTKVGLLEQLYNGWKLLSDSNKNKDIYVHLYTTSTPSTSAISGIETPPNHLAEFLSSYWCIENPNPAVVKKWKIIIDDFKQKIGAGDDFEDFRLHCQLDLNRRLPEDREEYDPAARYYKDISVLEHILLEKSGKTKGKIVFNTSNILNLTNWNDRFDFKAKHSFPTPEYYIPIETSVERFEYVISTKTRGYIALIGSPGSGKSTLLTETLRYKRKHRVFNYYCYVPDDAASYRGEAYNFLHDITLKLSNSGFTKKKSFNDDSSDGLKNYFSEQLLELGQSWNETGLCSVILIDGLDHIDRECNPENSLINVLPEPSAIPEGCLIVLGSQYLQNLGLSNRILVELEQDSERIITMDSLDRIAIREILTKTLPDSKFNSSMLELIEKRSQGHPLALSYIINRIKNTDSDEVLQILTEIPEYADNIENEYLVYWKTLERNENVREVLAYLSRMRGNIELDILSRIKDDLILREFIASAKHYFIELPNRKWKFFHNSFRQFLLDKTGRNAFGYDDLDLHKRFHKKLAQIAEEQIESEFRWELIYHTYNGGDSAKVLEIGSQEYFREQFILSRPINLILNDLKLVMKSAKELEDILTVFRVLLIHSELNQRNNIIEELNIHDMFLDIGKTDKAIKQVVFEGQLLIEQEKALDFASKIDSIEYHDIAKEIYDIAEPIDYLSGIMSNQSFGNSIIFKWVRTSYKFRSIKKVLNVICNIRVEKDFDFQSDEEASNNVRRVLVLKLVDELIQNNRFYELEYIQENIPDFISIDEIKNQITITNFKRNDFKADDVENIKQLNNSKSLKKSTLYTILETLLLNDYSPEIINELFESVPIPPRVVDDDYGIGYKHYSDRLRYYRIYSALQGKVNITIDDSNLNSNLQKGSTIIERLVIRLGCLWGEAWRKKFYTPSQVLHELSPAIRVFERRFSEELSLAFTGIHEEYIDSILSSANAHGKQCLQAVYSFIKTRWEKDVKGNIWYSSIRRHIALTVNSLDENKTELNDRINELIPNPRDCDNISDFLESCEEQFYAYKELEEFDEALKIISLMENTTFGIYHEKDHQVSIWLDWYSQLIIQHPSLAQKYLKPVVDGVCTVSKLGRGSSINKALIKFLSNITMLFPELLPVLKELFWEENVIDFQSFIIAISISCLHDEEIDVEIPIEIMSKLHFPYVKHVHTDILDALVLKLLRIDREYAISKFKYVIEKIKLEISKNTINDWFLEFDILFKKYENTDSFQLILDELITRNHTFEKSDYNYVIMQDGKKLTEQELYSKIESPKDLIELLSIIKEDHFYNWEHILKKIISDTLKEQIEILFSLFIKMGQTGTVLISLTRRLQKLCGDEVAEPYYLECLSQSKPHGWAISYDGGSRIKPYLELVKINTKYHKDAAFQFINDYLEGNYPYDVPGTLEDLSAVFGNEVPSESIWSELFEHIKTLYEFKFPIVSFDYNYSDNQESNMLEIIISEVAQVSTRPQPEIKDDSYRLLIDLYIKRPEIQNYIDDFTFSLIESEEDDFILLGLNLSFKILESFPRQIKNYSTRIIDKLRHNNISIRIASKRALEVCNKDYPIKHKTELPPYYNFDLSAANDYGVDSASKYVSSNDLLPETNDSMQLASVTKEALIYVSMQTGFSLNLLIERIVLLMKQIKPVSFWDKTAEKKIFDQCKQLRIETAYRRPRASIAMTALGYLVSELFDADYLDDNDLYVLDPYLSIVNFSIVNQTPLNERVININTQLPINSLSDSKDWKTSRPNMIDAPIDSSSSYKTIGIQVEMGIPLWTYPNESYVGSICSPYIKINNSEAIIPGRMTSFAWRPDQYPNLVALEEASNSIIIRGFTRRSEIGDANWIALNPIIAWNFNWIYDKRGLFQWKDEEGRIVARSKWWRNGRMNRYAPSDGIREEGWVVEVSQYGYEQIKEKLFPAKWIFNVRKTQNKEFDGENFIIENDLN